MTGLRLQILSSLALLTALLSGLLAVTLLGMATTSVERTLSGHIDTIQQSAATNMGKLLSVGASSGHVDEMATSWLQTGSIDGIWIFDGSGNPVAEFVRDDFRTVSVEPSFPTAARARSANRAPTAAPPSSPRCPPWTRRSSWMPPTRRVQAAADSSLP